MFTYNDARYYMAPSKVCKQKGTVHELSDLKLGSSWKSQQFLRGKEVHLFLISMMNSSVALIVGYILALGFRNMKTYSESTSLLHQIMEELDFFYGNWGHLKMGDLEVSKFHRKLGIFRLTHPL